MVAGKEITDEEKAFMVKAEKDNLMVPRTRIVEESAKTKTVQDELDALKESSTAMKTDFAEMKAELEILQNKGKPEDQLKAEQQVARIKELEGLLATSGSELLTANDALTVANGAVDSLGRSVTIKDLAVDNVTGTTFTNHSYLEFLANEAKLDLTNKEQVDAFMTNLQKSNKEQFTATVKPGNGTVPTVPASEKTKPILDMTDEEQTVAMEKLGSDKYMELRNAELDAKEAAANNKS